MAGQILTARKLSGLGNVLLLTRCKMGRINHDRHLNFDYNQEFIDLYNDQPEELKAKLDEWGIEFGYTAMNVFYILCWLYMVKYFGQYYYEPFVRYGL